MRHAIQYALTYPDRRPSVLPSLDLASAKPAGVLRAGSMSAFRACDWPTMHYVVDGTMPAVLNAANEVAVAAFLEELITFGEIARLIARRLRGPSATAGTGDTGSGRSGDRPRGRSMGTRLGRGSEPL
jgi:1-deoxy-D-xylulose-5-phosphate reductoisomerase